MRNKRLLTAKIAKRVREGRKEKRNELVKNFRERHIEKRNVPD